MSRTDSARKSNSIDMLSGSLLDKLCLFALPLAASSILQQLFNAADVAVVGRFAGKEAMAAVGANSSAINLMINLFVGLSVGANVVIAGCIGSGKQHRIESAVHTAVAFALCSGVFLVALGQAAARPLLNFMQTPDNVLEMAVLYLKIYFAGMPFIMFYNFGAAVLRSKGDSRRPLYCLLVSGSVNVLLNLLFVIAFGMGVAGVALATVASNAVSAAMIARFLLAEEGPFRLRPRRILMDRGHALKIIRIGAPAGIQGMVFSLSNTCIQSAINGFGAAAMAGSVAAVTFEGFGFFAVSAFSQACVTFTSQNYGAGNFPRCKKIFRYSLLCAIAANIAECAMFLIFHRPLLLLCSPDPAVLEFGAMRMFRALPFDWLMATYEVTAGVLRGTGRSMTPTVITVFGTCAFRLAWVYAVLPKFGTYPALMCVYPVSWALTGALMMATYFLLKKKIFCAERA